MFYLLKGPAIINQEAYDPSRAMAAKTCPLTGQRLPVDQPIKPGLFKSVNAAPNQQKLHYN
jgi:hypothetical protein